MIGFREWVVHAEQNKVAKSKAMPDRNDSEKLSTKKIVKRILEHRSADHRGNPAVNTNAALER